VSIELLEAAAAALAELLDDVVFVGCATITLWITDPAAPPPRPTKDVDVVVETTSRLAYHQFEARLRDLRFDQDQEDGVICRWRQRDTDLILDAMPADPSILGFSNRWHAESLPYAAERTLPSGASIRAVPPPYLLATKLEAFGSRGRGDFVASADFADIVALIDGREEIVAEVAAAETQLRRYLGDEFERLSAQPRFGDGLYGGLRPDPASQARAEQTVGPRIRAIIAAR
jgi:predicted nucleotidyltransferase